MVSLLTLGGIALLAACGGGGDGGGPTTPPAVASVASVAVTLSVASARVGETVTASATLRDAGGQALSGRAITWASSATSVASVDGNGAVTALTAGSTVISATSEGRSGSASLTVLAPVTLTVSIMDGDRQQARVGTAVLVPPVVVARDVSGAPAVGARLRFTVASGGGAVATTVATTDAAGRASPGSWTMGATLGEQTLDVTGAEAGVALASPLRLRATAVSATGVVTAPMRSYPITSTSATVLDDSVTGLRFVFPAGASGMFEVARVMAGPAAPDPGAIQFLASFTGNRSVEIAAVAPTGGAVDAYRWGRLDGAAASGAWTNAWWGLPMTRVRGDTSWFALRAQAAVPARLVHQTADVFIDQIAVNIAASFTADQAKRSALRTLSRETIDWWIDNAPFSLVSPLRDRVAAYPLSYSFGRGADSYYYYGFRSLWTASAYFNLDRVANWVGRHEPSHYMTHMLVGDARFNELMSVAPDSGHDIGVVAAGFRNTLLEEYAHIAQQLITGSVSGIDLRGLARRNGFRDAASPESPATVDFPSLEGFGAALMATLTRTGNDTLVYDDPQSTSQLRSPALAVTARQLLGVLAAGPRTPNELRDALVPVAGSDAALAAVAEPIGWSYRASGRLLDGNGTPIAGAVIASVVRVDGVDDRTIGSANTGSDGRFTLPRVYPGTSTLRVYRVLSSGRLDSLNAGTHTIPWTRATTEAVTLPDLQIPLTAGFNAVTVGISGFDSRNRLATTGECLTNMGALNWYDGVFAPVVWNGNQFTARGSVVYGGGTSSVRTTYEINVTGEIRAQSADTILVDIQGTGSQTNQGKRFIGDAQLETWVLLWRRGIEFSVVGAPMRTSTTDWVAAVRNAAAMPMIRSASMFDVDQDLGHNGEYAKDCIATSVKPESVYLQVVFQRR